MARFMVFVERNPESFERSIWRWRAMSEALSAPNDGVNMRLPRQPGGSEGSMTKQAALDTPDMAPKVLRREPVKVKPVVSIQMSI